MIQDKLFGYKVDSLAPFIAIAIIINSVAIFAGAFPGLNSSTYTLLEVVDYICAWIFLAEAIIKICRFGWKSYIQKNWNRFDMTLVVLSSPVLLMPVLGVQGFGVILTLRWARLIRLFKVLAFIPNREKLLGGIRRALKASISVFLGIIFLLIFASLSSTMAFNDIAPELFGDPFTSAYSMFKIFTIEGWFEIPAQLIAAKDVIWWSLFVKGYFIIFVVSGGMIGLSMLNAVFVDALVEDNNEGIEERLDRIEETLKLFIEKNEK